MNYYALKNRSLIASFKEAVLSGAAPNQDLFFPETLVRLEESFFEDLENLPYFEVCFRVLKDYVDSINEREFYELCKSTFTFEPTLTQMQENLYVLELFNGPTAAFKDYGAQFMATIFEYFSFDFQKELVILTATSGDTGGAIARAFFEKQNIKAIILYPSKKISPLQEKHISSLGKNIIALEIDGTFDDCQLLVKKAFDDKQIREKLNITSANSINIARLLPQIVYYVFAYIKLKRLNKNLVFVVPSGNFGNITAGLFAWEMGMNTKKFVAALNANDAFLNYLETSIFIPQETKQTLSNAMDVGNPSNFVRLKELYKDNYYIIKNKLDAFSISDEETVETIKKVYEKYGYILDPHGAVGFRSAELYLNKENSSDNLVVVLETAHASKFNDVLKEKTGLEANEPESFKFYDGRQKQSIKFPYSFQNLKEFLLSDEI